jgi:AcrR family transcriptional regulator
MSPRAYIAGKRRLAATAATRKKIIDAARALLAESAGESFSIDAIAERADVARMTVYYQFKSKAGLLEALFDDFAQRANMRQMRKVFEETDVSKSLAILVDVFCHLWDTEGTLVRRLTALAALDPEVDLALRERGNWRREALANILQRLPTRRYKDELVEMLYVLTSFEAYEMLKTAQAPKSVPAALKRTVNALLKSH